ncbi:PAS domain-containing protein [Thalassobaculum sp. OXR-137]|uniref:PAS domain-containing protein n=1 Tax=Thalassobaculum sp. OXR-137 TaxID=3100173 RepID=UPI002AC9E73A|nr:PAS domain-containing protein [Thalassobaculum sp. OXR-137]WPZ36595.1 PAS domain-containing protein [Thalassobaculum sp. OXR-137]
MTAGTNALECADVCAGRTPSLGAYEAPCVCDRGGQPAAYPNFGDQDLHALLRYWLSLKTGDRIPERRDFDPIRVSALLSRFWIIRREADTGRYKFLLAGEQIRSLFGRRVADIYVDDLFGEHETTLHDALSEVIDTPAIHYASGPLYRAGMYPLHTERLALPMAEDGVVNTVYGVTLYRRPTAAPSTSAEYIGIADPVVLPVRDLPCQGCLLF